MMCFEWFTNPTSAQVDVLIKRLRAIYGTKRVWPNEITGEVMVSIQLDPTYSMVCTGAGIEETVATWCKECGVVRRPKQY